MPFKIVRNDITKMQVDAIVNTANEQPIYSSGIDTAVYEAAGVDKLLADRRRIGALAEGEVAITPGFKLPAKYIIHAVSPYYIDGECGEAEKLRSCYEKSLQLALEYGCKSIAFPLIATGSYEYPKAEGMEIALNAIHSFLMKEDIMVYLVVFDREAVRLSGLLYDEIESYIDEHYVAEKSLREYCDRSTRSMVLRAEASYIDSAEAFEEDYFDDEDIEYEDGAPEEILLSAPDIAEDVCECRILGQQAPRSLEDIMEHIGETFQEMLFRLIKEKGRDEVEVYKGACKDKKLFYKIRNNVNYQPTKHTVYAFAISLRLSLDELKDLLQAAGFAISPSNRFDLIMTYIFQHKIYDMYKIDCILYDFKEEHYFSCE